MVIFSTQLVLDVTVQKCILGFILALIVSSELAHLALNQKTK